MPIFNLYHKRKQQVERAGEPDVYCYDTLPPSVRFQTTRILARAIGPYESPRGSVLRSRMPPNNNDAWRLIRSACAEELGRDFLRISTEDAQADTNQFINEEADVDLCLSVVEFGLRYIERVMGEKYEASLGQFGATCKANEAISEINARFHENGVGYQFENGQIVRVDSELIHAEIVKPALLFLSDPRLKGPEEEYYAAHAHYRAGEYEDAIVDANRAFESVMRTICDLMGSPAPEGATASSLLSCIRKTGILPDYLDGSFDQLVAVLKSGLPAVRNNAGGHGQGSTPRQTPAYVAGYALHLCASNILFLVEAFKDAEESKRR